MSRFIATRAIEGAGLFFEEASLALKEALERFGRGAEVSFQDTAYYLPFIYTIMGREVKILQDLEEPMKEAERLLPLIPEERHWLPYLGDALDAGISTLISLETLCATRYLRGEVPPEPWNGFISDTILRSLGLQLVDGRMPGFAVIIGAPPSAGEGVRIVRALQERNILTFLLSDTKGVRLYDMLNGEGVEMGWPTYLVPIGEDIESSIYVLNWAIRVALTFGGMKGGMGKEALLYCRDRVFAFALVLGEIDAKKYAVGAGALNFGFPVIADEPGPEIRPSGITLYEAVVREGNLDRIVERAIEVRGVRVRKGVIPVPVLCGAAFEGERVRRKDMRVEFGGKATPAFELLKGAESGDVEDGRIVIDGPDIDSVAGGGALPLAFLVKVSGRKMNPDFEPILERHLHSMLNQGMGVFHMGQRDVIWIRIGRAAFSSGFRLKHLGEIAIHMLKNEFPGIADKVEVEIITLHERVNALLPEAKRMYGERDRRLEMLTDEEVDLFYSCTLCQSFAPNHVCIITPERLGLCGAYNWLDGRAAYEINPLGPNQPVPKEICLDRVKGKWRGVNRFVFTGSGKTIPSINLYSIMEDPMTSCGCFECIAAILPEVNGFMVVERNFQGMTPCGMNFTTLAGIVGGGQQTPGFMGIGILYILSKKFISADGGLKRIVWMNRELMERLGARLGERCIEAGEPELPAMIADETIATDIRKLAEFLLEKGHPALSMPPLI